MTDACKPSDAAPLQSRAEPRLQAHESCLVPLEAILFTDALKQRPTRAPDHPTENRALVTLAQALADAPRSAFQTLADTLLEAFKAGSAGVSLLTKDEKSFFWPAVAGLWQAHIGSGTPRDFGPCGDVLDCNAPLLFKHPERRYPYFLPFTPWANECLLVPFRVAGKAVGTIWVVAHDERRQFDAEDLRQLESLGRFASAAYQTVASLDERLRSHHDTFFHLIESAPFGVYVIDSQFRMCQASAVSLNTFSNVQPLIGRDFEEIVRAVWTEPFASEVLARFRHTLETGEAYVAPSTIELRKDIPGVESYDWKIHRIALPDGQFGVVCHFYDVTERQLAEDALRERDAFTRSIIKSSPDCIKVLDLEGKLLSMQSGQELLGIEDIQPFLNTSWIELWDGEHRQAAQAAVASAVAGEAARFVGFFRTFRGEPKWWDVAVSPILGLDGKPARLLSVSRDVTQRRQAELNLEFLASVSRDLVQWSSMGEMLATIGARTAAYLQLSLCAFVEIDETAEQVVIHHDWHRDDVPSLVGVHRLADFVEEQFVEVARAGDVIVVRDALTDLTDPEKFAALKIASFVCVPLVRDGQWRFALCLYKSEAYDWRHDQIELTRELTARIWTRMERLQAEAALRESEQRYRTLFESIDEGFCIIEKLEGEADAPLDFRFVEANQALEVQSGVRDVIGKTIRQVIPNEFEEWLATFDAVLRTGEPIRFERGLVSQGRVLELYALRVQDETQRRVAVLFKDVTRSKQAEDALRQSTARFECLLNESPLGVYLIDADFRLVQANPTGLQVFGPIPDLIGRDFAEVMHIVWPETVAEAHIEQFRRTLETGEACVVAELIAKRADRQTTEYYEWQINRIRLPDGRHGVACYFRDISERVLAQEKIRDNEWRMRYATESARLTFVEIDLVSGLARTPENFAAVMGYVPSFGHEGDASVGARVLLEHVVPADRERVGAALQEFFGGKPVGQLEYRVLGDDRIERWVETRWSLVLDPVGQPLRSFATNLDITERKLAEEALRQSEERFRALFDWGPIAMYSCDRAGMIQEYNRGAVKLWDREPKPGDTDEKFRGSFKTYLPDGTFLPYNGTLMTRILKGEAAAAHDMEVVIERLDGSRLNLIVNVVPLRNDQGEVTGAITCFYDVTERSRLERELLKQAEALADLGRRKDEFLAMLSHELRNPLAALSNATHMLRVQKSEEPMQARARVIIERQLGQLKHLVGDLLDISRVTTGRVQLRLERVTMSGIVERAVETALPLIQQRRHELTLSQPPQLVWLQADAARLEQVLVNLLTNAAKYTDEGGHIVLSVEQQGDVAVLRVRDTGIGIAPELLPRIFDLFTQAERSLGRSQGGLGIGLCLVQRLVELHGGSVEAYSVLGQGSEFVVRLPALATLALPSLVPADVAAQPPEKRARVLVVDDNVDAAESLAMVLEVAGHEVRVAHDGAAALIASLDYGPDIVLLDIGLPGIDGYEVARRMRRQAGLENVVLVALTGYGRDTDRQHSRDAGFDHHLVKPADLDMLLKILETVPRTAVGPAPAITAPPAP